MVLDISDEDDLPLEKILEMDWQYFYQERAAIREYDGGMSRPLAETMARRDFVAAWREKHGTSPGLEVISRICESVPDFC